MQPSKGRTVHAGVSRACKQQPLRPKAGDSKLESMGESEKKRVWKGWAGAMGREWVAKGKPGAQQPSLESWCGAEGLPRKVKEGPGAAGEVVQKARTCSHEAAQAWARQPGKRIPDKSIGEPGAPLHSSLPSNSPAPASAHHCICCSQSLRHRPLS